MFRLTHQNKKARRKQSLTRHQLGVENRLESRDLMSAAALVGGILTVNGTRAGESIQLDAPTPKTGEQVLVVSENGVPFAKFAASDVKRIEVHAFGGDDKISVNGSVNAPILLDGGAGNDSIAAGSNGAVVLGGAGDDLLFGGAGRDIIIGGLGSDRIAGNGGDDVLVGGGVTIENDSAALFNQLERWNRDLPYEQRVASLNSQTSKNGRLTVINDNAVDFLAGNNDRDLFLAGKGDQVLDRDKAEDVL